MLSLECKAFLHDFKYEDQRETKNNIYCWGGRHVIILSSQQGANHWLSSRTGRTGKIRQRLATSLHFPIIGQTSTINQAVTDVQVNLTYCLTIYVCFSLHIYNLMCKCSYYQSLTTIISSTQQYLGLFFYFELAVIHPD